MAHYHSHTRIIGRSAGRSAVAAAAYRAGEKLRNDFEECVSDFSRRGGVIHTEIMAPEGASPWVYSREALWNRVEATEKRKDAQLAREVELALPHELSHEQRLDLVRQYVAQQFVGRGMVADISIHEGHTDERNVHAHVMLTMRELLPEGFGRKVTEWNDYRNVKHWRREWARHQNRAYREAGLSHQVDERSYRDQGIDRRPTIHEGPKARRMRERGFQPRSKTVRRRSWTGRPHKPIEYRRLDLGRTRRQRNQQIVWGNRARGQSDKLGLLVEAHIHRFSFENTWAEAGKTGKKLRQAGKDARRAEWLEERARDIFRLHRERMTDLMLLTLGNPDLRGKLDDYILYRAAKIEQARMRLVHHHRAAKRTRRLQRRLAKQYRALKSRLGDRESLRIRRQLEHLHIDALRGVSEWDIRSAPLTERQKSRLLHDRARVRERHRQREFDIADLLDESQ